MKPHQWREIFESLRGGIIALSSEFEPIASNAAAEDLLGVPKLNQDYLRRLIDLNAWLRQMIDSCLETGQGLETGESLVVGDREIAVRAEISPLLNGEGESQGLILLLNDLSHRKGPVQAFEHDTGIGLSPAGLAHEVKNPLTGIKGAAELLASMMPRDERAQQYCAVIIDSANRIAALVEQVLAASGPQRFRYESVNIHKILHDALRMAGLYPAEPGGVRIEQAFDPSLPEISGDASALERVFLNLIRNALEAVAAVSEPSTPAPDDPSEKAQSGHWIRLRTAIEPQFRKISGGKRRQFLRVEISDSGKGMTPDEIKQLFTPFYTTKPSGTGLGLVLSQRIVASHGGKLWAETGELRHQPAKIRPGVNDTRVAHGLTFCVILPIGSE